MSKQQSNNGAKGETIDRKRKREKKRVRGNNHASVATVTIYGHAKVFKHFRGHVYKTVIVEHMELEKKHDD